jgi:AcrR family transcriptional regulator
MQASSTARRADAQRNRELIVASAATAFAAHGPVSIEAIARGAGLGSATLYRHFPTREDLVEEVYRDQVRPLRDEASALTEALDPVAAMRAWMQLFATWAAERRGIAEALVAMSASGRFGTGPVCDEVLQIMSLLIDRGIRAGVFRTGLDPADVSALLTGALSVAGGADATARLDGLLDLIVDGMRHR